MTDRGGKKNRFTNKTAYPSFIIQIEGKREGHLWHDQLLDLPLLSEHRVAFYRNPHAESGLSLILLRKQKGQLRNNDYKFLSNVSTRLWQLSIQHTEQGLASNDDPFPDYDGRETISDYIGLIDQSYPKVSATTIVPKEKDP
ncbi:hypothetical protein Tco_1237267 [Tanacetum coccineum]